MAETQFMIYQNMIRRGASCGSHELTSLVRPLRLNDGWSYGEMNLRLTSGGSMDGSENAGITELPGGMM